MKTAPRLSLYWKCQLAGWSVASLYWTYMGVIGTHFSILLATIHFGGDLLIYILPTHVYRNISRKYGWHTLRPGKLLNRIIPAVMVLGSVFMVLTIGKNFLVRWIFEQNFDGSFVAYFNNSWQVTIVTGIRLMAIWLLAYYLYHYAQREIKATKESARLSIIAKDAQLNNLTAQLNPHFFFNSLNNIKAMVTRDPVAARRAIDLLSDLLRTSLYHRDTALITVHEELSLVKDYLELEKMRFEERLQIDIQIDDAAQYASILALSIQALMENAIKHGIAQRKEGGAIQLRIEKKDTQIVIQVRNPGKLSNHHTNGLGLKNLVERLELQFNGRASFALQQETTDTVIATLKMPVE